MYTNEWKIVIYYDLTNLQLEFAKLQEYADKMNTTCNILKEHDIGAQFCHGLTELTRILIMEIKLKDDLIQSTNRRQKRGLFNAVGSLSKTLFGTLDENDARAYDEKITKVQQNEDYLLHLIRNHTSIIETTVNIFNRTRSHIDEQFIRLNHQLGMLNTSLNRIKEEIMDNRVMLELENLATFTTILLIRHQASVDTLIDLLTELKHGKPHPSIITPKQIQEKLFEIQKHLPPTLSLPISINDNLFHIYQLTNSRTGILNNKIIFELTLPLPFMDQYQLYKVTALPTPHQNKFLYVQPSLEYLMIDLNREHYYTLNTIDLNNCFNEDKTYLCQTIHPIFNEHSANNLCEIKLLNHATEIPQECEIKLIPKTNYWIQLSQPNSWIYVLKEQQILDTVCGNSIFPTKLKDSGIIEIKPNCHLRSKEFIIQSHNVNITQINDYYLPANNLTIDFKETELTRDISEIPTQIIKFYENDKLYELSEQISQQKHIESQNLPQSKIHTIHHYVISYTTLIILIIFIIYFIKNKIKERKQCNEVTYVKNEDVNFQNDTRESPKFKIRIQQNVKN